MLATRPRYRGRVAEVTAELRVRKPDGTLVPVLANDAGEVLAADEVLRADVASLTEIVTASPAPTTYLHIQSVPSARWEITHPLGFNPAVTVLDSTGRQVEGDVSYPDLDTVLVEFNAAFSGSAHLS